MTEMFEKNDFTAKLLFDYSYIHSHVLSSSSSSSFCRERGREGERDVEVKSYLPIWAPYLPHLPRKGMLLLVGLVFTIWWYIGILSSGYIYSSFPALLGILCGVVCSLRMSLVKLLTDATSTFTSCDWLPTR